MGLLHQEGQVCPGGEELNVQQVGAVGVQHQLQELPVFSRGQGYLSALCLGAEGHQQQLVLQGDPQLCQTAGYCAGRPGVIEMVYAPFHTIGWQCGKLDGLFQNGGFGALYNGQDGLGAALPDGAATNIDTGHRAPPLYIRVDVDPRMTP